MKSMTKDKRRKKAIAAISVMLILSVWFVFFAVYSAVISGTILLSSIKLPSEYTMEITVGENKKKPDMKLEIKESDLMVDGVPYVNFSLLADLCSFPVSGDPDVLKYKIEGSDGQTDYLTVCINEEKVRVNTSEVSVSGGILVKDGEVYLPCGFVNDYVCGISIGVDEEEKTVSVTVTGDYSLKLKDDKANEKIDISRL